MVDSVIWAKIWGLKRSGTNYLRWILEHDLRGVLPVSDIGGWKHGIPGPLTRDEQRWWPEGRPEDRPPVADRLSEILAAEASGTLRHLLCVRHPLAWLCSVCRYRGGPGIRRTPVRRLRRRLGDWNARGSVFLAFHDRIPAVSRIVRYEDLYPIGDGAGMHALARWLGVQVDGEEMPPRRLRNAGDYWNVETLMLSERFVPRDWRSESAPLATELARAVDQSVADRLGYQET